VADLTQRPLLARLVNLDRDVANPCHPKYSYPGVALPQILIKPLRSDDTFRPVAECQRNCVRKVRAWESSFLEFHH
jgi:hypothetical protein